MTREPNAVDFWRGFALITIFIDHVPGLVYRRFTLVNFSISDAADLFVFLAGWSLRLMADGGGRHMPTRDIMLRLFGRALELYAAQVLITMLAIAMLAVTAIELNNPLLLRMAQRGLRVQRSGAHPYRACGAQRINWAISISCRFTWC